MARELLSYFTPSIDGQGIEGFINWANTSVDNLLIPLFLIVFYSLGIFFITKNDWKTGGQLMLLSLVFVILGAIGQTITSFDQLAIFIFAIGAIVGAVISFMEN
jgi:hypothetical protein